MWFFFFLIWGGQPSDGGGRVPSIPPGIYSQPGEQRLSCRLGFQRLFIKHVPRFSNSKDGILQQSPIELILTLSLGFREERMCEGKKKRGYNA